MTLTRRSFLSGVITLTAYAMAPKIARATEIPRIWGDGIHDDAPGLNAFFANEAVEIEEVNGLVPKAGWIEGGKFLIRRPLEFTGQGIFVRGARFVLADEAVTTNSLFRFRHG